MIHEEVAAAWNEISIIEFAIRLTLKVGYAMPD